MRRRRKSHTAGLGESLSFEEVLTVITVLLLLRVVFMVPMVNLDKAKTVAVQIDKYWARATGYVLSKPSADADLRPYRAAFGIRDMQGFVTRDGAVAYVEAATEDSELVVIRHNPSAQRFIALRAHASSGQAFSFQRGRLLWSNSEEEWFIASDTVDYGSHASSKEMEARLRAWTRKERGY
jgi:hypothetical protein